MIRRTSLAAQDYVLSGTCEEYDPRLGHMFKSMPGYINVHKKYHLPYNPNAISPATATLNPGLVMDLAWSLRTDMINHVIDANGGILNPRRLAASHVLRVYHNTRSSGTPANALYLLKPSQLKQMVANAYQKTK